MTIRSKLKESIYVLSSEHLKDMLFIFMLIVLTTEKILTKSLIVGIILYIIAIAMTLRIVLFKDYKENE